MYNKVLVPLDGSELAECALPHVINLAKGGMVKDITLLNVVEVRLQLGAGGLDLIEIKKDLFNKAQKYLAGLQSRLRSKGLKVNVKTIRGNVAESIINYSQKNAIDLIIIATHGYTGVKKFMLGSVALRILHHSKIPVLMIRP
jgi:nucleotide-binding universal stress UspA family protein